MAVNKRVVFSNLIWRYSERSAAQIVSFIVSIILARFLTPKEFGTVALMNVFINIMQVFASSGLGSALIQKKDSDIYDFSTVFWTQLFFCTCVYAILFFISPLIARFYNREELVFMTRIAGISILISGIRNIQLSYVTKHLQFKRFFFATLLGTLISAVIGIYLAYKGVGAWALVIQNLTNLFIDSIILWITVNWHPFFYFSFSKLSRLFGFGFKMFLTSFIDTVYGDIRTLIIGKVYSPSDLALYNRGKAFPNIVVKNINTSINSVLYPVMAQSQDNREELKSITRRSMKTSIFFIAPMMIGLAVTAPLLVKVLLTEKWNESIPYIRIFSLAMLFTPVNTANISAIKALGRSDVVFKLSVIKKIIGITVLLISMQYSVKVIALGYLFCALLSQIINTIPNYKFLNYSYFQQFLDIVPYLLVSVFMGLIIYPIQLLHLPNVLLLILQIIAGGLIYYLAVRICRLEAYTYIKKMIKKDF